MFLFEGIYRISVWGYFSLIKIAAFFNRKAKLWVGGRRKVFEKLTQSFKHEKSKILWIHCASLGEFEQGRPLIELIKNAYPDWKILLTFFSPSGFEIRKNYEMADWVFYLPEDSPKNARRFLEIVKPDITVFVKYEFWYFYLKILNEKQIPTFLISAVFRKKQIFFKPFLNRIHLRMLESFEHIFVQNDLSESLLKSIGITDVSTTGDTRIDRVLQGAKNVKSFPEIASFCEDKKILVCGSTWEKDEEIILSFINKNSLEHWKFIIASHDIQITRIQSIIKKARLPILKYSELKNHQNPNAKILIMDNIGMLSSIYQYGHLAYIGGGFGSGIHNILEPGAFGLPIIFGPNFQKFEEAKFLTQNGGAFSINNQSEFEVIFEKLKSEIGYKKASETVRNYLKSNEGATLKIAGKIHSYLTQ